LHTVSPGPETVSQAPVQAPNVEGGVGVAVSEIAVPLIKLALHGPEVDGQLRPAGELVTFPLPAPGKVTVSIGPELLTQATFAVMNPVTMAPEEERFPAL